MCCHYFLGAEALSPTAEARRRHHARSRLCCPRSCTNATAAIAHTPLQAQTRTGLGHRPRAAFRVCVVGTSRCTSSTRLLYPSSRAETRAAKHPRAPDHLLQVLLRHLGQGLRVRRHPEQLLRHQVHLSGVGGECSVVEPISRHAARSRGGLKQDKIFPLSSTPRRCPAKLLRRERGRVA